MFQYTLQHVSAGGPMRIAIAGGTGREARGLALRWARAGPARALGSRDAVRVRARAVELTAPGSDGRIEGGDNAWAVARADVVVLSVPYRAHRETLLALKPVLAGRLLLDVTVPLVPEAACQVH